jgi:transposase-like protein
MSGHASPFYCPYCADEDIRPHGTSHGEWRCGACTRVWTLRLQGLRPTEPPGDEPVRPHDAVEVAR